MSINISQQLGISVDTLLERLINERAVIGGAGKLEIAELPILHPGPMGPLHRRDIYDGVR